jgi:hypothetical protein
MCRSGFVFVCVLSFSISIAAQDAHQFVEQAVRTEMAADAADHTHWLYFDTDQRPEHSLKQWTAETRNGNLDCVIEENGKPISKDEQLHRMDHFIADTGAQEKQRKAGAHDDKQASEMLGMLPQAFLWTITGVEGSNTVLHFKPNPQFHPPDYQARVFAAMEGDMAVDTVEHRIASLKGKLIEDVKFGGGFLGKLESGGSFDVERRETGKGEWQITETHVHMQGHMLLFKSISEQEDEVKSQLKQLPGNETLADAEKLLLTQNTKPN